MKEELVLDALAWATVKEPARVAKIAARLIRARTQYDPTITKTAIADAVRETLPPHGRGKAINEAVARRVEEVRPLYLKRQADHAAWKEYLNHKAKRATRLNEAYAARFDRPAHEGARSNPLPWGHAGRQTWDETEAKRDKGDTCIGLMIYQDVYTVCLLASADKLPGNHYIATRDRMGGAPVYTALRDRCDNFVEAAISLGGPQARSALARGYPVLTDWTGRRTVITYPTGKVVELPWRSQRYILSHEHNHHKYFNPAPCLVHGDQEMDEPPKPAADQE